MINELIEQIGGRERLEQIKKSASSDANETVTMARALLAVLGQGCLHHWISSEGRTASGWLCSKCGDYDGPPAASAPEGWKLMPLKASPEILQAGIKAHYERQKHQQPEDVEFKGPMECAYDDMLSAAPSPDGTI